MAETPDPESADLAESFQRHLKAFYDSLPSAERDVLQQMCDLARSASEPQGGEVQGFAGVGQVPRPAATLPIGFLLGKMI